MIEKIKLVLFQVDTQKFAIQLSSVERVIQVVEICPLPNAPEFIMGTINFHGKFVPVANLRNLFNLPLKELDLSDQLILVNTANLTIALWVDSTGEIVEHTEEEISTTKKIMLDTKYVKGIFKFEDGMVLLHDLDNLLTMDEIRLLHEALKNTKNKEVISTGGT